jgi:hypothetical protein
MTERSGLGVVAHVFLELSIKIKRLGSIVVSIAIAAGRISVGTTNRERPRVFFGQKV